jgi:FAD/FMN-containing dehydrogenase
MILVISCIGKPIAVLKPGSIEDIIRIIQFARTYKIKIAARGQGHSTYGQSQVEAGVIIDMSTLNKIHSIGADRAIVEAGVVWSQLLQQTLKQGLTPPVLTDYIELSIGGTLAVGGIGGATHRYGVQVDNVWELQVVTGEGKLETCSKIQNAVVTRMLSDNRRLFEKNRDEGGYRYAVNAIPFSQNDWQQHFGTVWGKLVSAKRRYDPGNLLTPGQGIF